MTIAGGLDGPFDRVPNQRGGFPKDIEPVQIWLALWRGRRLIWLAMAIGMLLGAVYYFALAQPRYAATATMVLQQQDDLVSEIAGAGQTSSSVDMSQLNTELHILQSRGLVLKLVEQLGLDQDTEFNPSPTASSAQRLNQVVQNVQSAISAREQRNSQIVTVTATSKVPEKAVQMANALTRIYVEEQIATKYAAAQTAETWLSERVGTLRQALSEQEREIAQLRSKTEVTASADLSLMATRLQDTRTRLADITERVNANASELQGVQALREAGKFPQIAAMTGNRALEQLLSAADNEGYSPAIETQLDAMEADLKLQQSRLDQQAQVLLRSVKELNTKLDAQGVNLGVLQQLEREAQATRVLYETLLARLREASTLRGLQQANARVLSPAVVGRDQSASLAMVLLVAAAVGVLVAGVYVLVRKFVHAGFRTADELEQVTNKPVLGQLPAFPVKDRSRLLPFLATHPTSAVSEAVRNLRTSLLMSHPDRPPQVILSASAVPGEGKTSHAIALAQNFSAMGKQVLLIDGDMRRRTLSSYFSTDHTAGVVAALMDGADLASVVQHIPSLGADVLLGAPTTASAADVFASRQFSDLIARSRLHYDVVIIDSPPVLVVPDARVISRYVDAIIFSVAWDQTTRRQVEAGLKQFDLVGSPVTGMVLSQIKPKKLARYGDEGTNEAYSGFGRAYYDTV
ncbi:GumC family protein [Aliiroseovarius sp. 2305UL8-7]|uniref:GumC family protein n=1 Tax=Aliiroseovarius conchicola TaxID=3121637 RepID=UPI0035292279